MTEAKFVKGQKVCRYYTAEPAFIYGKGRIKEDGIVLGDPVEWDGELWVPVKWQCSICPDLSLGANVLSWEE